MIYHGPDNHTKYPVLKIPCCRTLEQGINPGSLSATPRPEPTYKRLFTNSSYWNTSLGPLDLASIVLTAGSSS